MGNDDFELPFFTSEEMQVLDRIKVQSPRQFITNCTKYLKNQILKYIKQSQVLRITIMGEVRTGKSETAQTLAIWYCNIFNYFLRKQHFDKLDVFHHGLLEKRELKITSDNIYSSQSAYIYYLREMQKENKLSFGQIHIIDETKEGTGGLGSTSEEMELRNMSNIVAKFMQSEIWINPLKLSQRNCPFGIKIVKKDIGRKVNWGLMYKIDYDANSITYNVMGWVKIPLHDDEALRSEYNEKKNLWIKDEIEGAIDPRALERKKIAKLLADDPDFSAMKGQKGLTFVLPKDQQIAFLTDWIIERKTQKWNEMEIYRIVEDARAIAQKRIRDKNKELEKEKQAEKIVKDEGEEE